MTDHAHNNYSTDPETYNQSPKILLIGKMLLASVSGLSFLGSLFVICTAFLFKSIFQKKVFMQIVLAISVSDFIANVALLGGDMPENFLCKMQGACVYFFYRASWMYTVALSHQLYSLVYYGLTSLTIYQIHAIVFVIDAILEFIPLVSTDYGNDDLAEGKLPCSIKGGQEGNEFAGGLHGAVTFNIPILACFLVMLFFYLRIKWKFYFQSSSLREYPVITSAVNLVGLYPFSMMICWVPLILYTFFINSLDAKKGLLLAYYWIFSSGCLYGFVLSIIFICKSNEARRRWGALLMSLFCKFRNNPASENSISNNTNGDPVVQPSNLDNADSLSDDNADGYMDVKTSTRIMSIETVPVNLFNTNNQKNTPNFDSIEIRANSNSSDNPARHFSSEGQWEGYRPYIHSADGNKNPLHDI